MCTDFTLYTVCTVCGEDFDVEATTVECVEAIQSGQYCSFRKATQQQLSAKCPNCVVNELGLRTGNPRGGS